MAVGKIFERNGRCSTKMIGCVDLCVLGCISLVRVRKKYTRDFFSFFFEVETFFLGRGGSIFFVLNVMNELQRFSLEQNSIIVALLGSPFHELRRREAYQTSYRVVLS